MEAPENQGLGRREFLRTCGRWFGLGGLGLVGGAVATKRKGVGSEDCTNRGICGNCSRVVDCRLPQALSFREVNGR